MRTADLFATSVALMVSAFGPSASEAAGQSIPGIERDALCPMKVEPTLVDDVECGWLTVPGHEDSSDAPLLRLPWAIARAVGPDPARDPVVVIVGGPGGATLSRLQGMLSRPRFRTIREQRDLVFLDVRGTGFSEPSVCTEVDDVLKQVDILVVGTEEVNDRLVAAAKSCADGAMTGGPDPATYNSRTVASDFAHLRRLLGYERWNLIGTSYGGRYAQTLTREDPEGVRAVVLESPVTLGQPWSRTLALREALDAVFEQCAAAPACAAAYPDLAGDIERLLIRAEESPIRVEVDRSVPLQGGQFVLTREVLVRYIQSGLGREYLSPTLPFIIHEASRGNDEVLLAFLESAIRGPRQSDLAEGLALATLCYDDADVTPEFLADVRARHPLLDTGGWFDARLDALCPHLHPARASVDERTLTDTGIPTLILGGEHDSSVPHSMFEYAAGVESGATLVSIPFAGHSIAGMCSDRFVADFIADPETLSADSCAPASVSIPFVTDVRSVAGLGRFASAVLFQYPDGGSSVRRGALTVWPLGSLLILVLAPLLWAVRWAWRRVRKPPLDRASGGTGVLWLAAISAAVSALFLVGFQSALAETMAVSPMLVLASGMPARFGWVFVLPWFLLALASAVGLSAVMAWRRGWWSPWMRLHYSLVAVAVVAFTSFLWSWPLV